MKTRRACRGVTVLLGLFLTGSAGFCSPLEPEYPETKQLVTFVQRAAGLVASQGEAAFSAFRQKGSEWFQGDSYLFVFDLAGVNLCHPAQPDLEGKNLLDLKDINGKLIVQSLLRAVSGEGRAGWTQYQWPRPGQTEPVWKSSHQLRVTAPSGKEYVVGSGVYPTRTERMFVVGAVEGAAALLREQGEAGFSRLRDRAGDFIFGDVYVFVLDWAGTTRVHPVQPELEGQNLLDLKDTNGKLFIREMFRLLQASESGWVDYQWPRPGATVASRKSSYVQRVEVGKASYLVGAGVYPE